MAAAIGFCMMSSVVAGILLGRLLDAHFGTKPWATIVGIVLGMIAGMWAIYKRVMEGK